MRSTSPKLDVPEDFSRQVKNLRLQHGLTQTQLAEHLGVSFTTVNRWENGQSRPSPLAWLRVTRLADAGTGAIGERLAEPAATYAYAGAEAGPGTPIELDFQGNADKVWVVAEGERLTYGHLFNPAFATETSQIDALPHQRIAVYEHLLPQSRLRFLLADDAGAGKTIMTGLYIREMLARRLIRRVLVIPPAGLVGNWEHELRTLFSLGFRIVSGADARLGNPFVGQNSDLVIVSVDTLASGRTFERLRALEVEPYDLVIFDEAHKLSADRDADLSVRTTERYRLAEALAGIPGDDPDEQLGWSAHHLLLLSATPHMGKKYPYYSLWRLLEPEVLSSIEAFDEFPAEARQRHFLRRTKEELVTYDGKPLYPPRSSDTLSYELSPGEQELYDATSEYIQRYYNRARILNRAAAQLARSVFQRRLASSTYALLRSFERRLTRLDRLIDQLRAGTLKPTDLAGRDRDIAHLPNVFDTMTADEERTVAGLEENETLEEQALETAVTDSLGELEDERRRVRDLVTLAHQVHGLAAESKFERLRDVLRDPRYRDEKLIIFTEHRDTLEFLVQRLEGLGFTGQIARIHGGLDYQEREEQVAYFRRPVEAGGARYLVATDAAGEGINLQFCWLMVNYDIPWNPARLEQRMGRIHRYGQKRDQVIVINLIAGKTREGRVMKILLDKLEQIRRELGSDKVFDVVGRLFEGLSLANYLEQSITDDGASRAAGVIEGKLTAQQVKALAEIEQKLYGDGGDVKRRLPELQRDLGREELRRLLPGYVRRFVEKAAPLIGIGLEGDLDGCFHLTARNQGALDSLWSTLEAYSPEARACLTVIRPSPSVDAVFLHPGEPFFDRFRAYACAKFAPEAERGAVFIDPSASRPYLFHLALVTVVRQADPAVASLAREEAVSYRLVGFRQEETSDVEECPVEHLLLLKSADLTSSAAASTPLHLWRGARGEVVPVEARSLASLGRESSELARAFAVERVARPLAEQRRDERLHTLPEREGFLGRGYDFQEASLAERRAKISPKALSGDAHARGQLTRIRDLQRSLAARRDEALAALRREPELIGPGDVTFLAHALIVPSPDLEDRLRHDAAIEAVAMLWARAHEEATGAVVFDVSTPEGARLAGVTDRPGFDLLSTRANGEVRAIEVKGRARIGDVELTENEWAKACNLRERYWLYVVYDCASAFPRTLRVRDPFGRLIATPLGGMLIDHRLVIGAAETQ